ncbi:type II toxin-antitoxin system RelE/ParE family toxin [Enterocloster asparagiformis]|uniref:Plasmid stabilization system protein, RelE/ParE family n=2 Tax=Enterocloster asparagiformis TaxID=333367 RepID=C0CUY9_9FIRM|nr:type II toxin-antitoxin system RelE/ParE family toxin [Enterocloster asparagiformis]EEG57104.1 plasmid stabilization system protein, RelE/ParE family [[Clostridium] asparagiforme DSM 15981]RGX29299.1 type II toxin-antitoxin system RelE/ParE family toxin [Enterocloster asparagiformis]UWO76962.1 type II toxin-antitoxin system RelE/ParE family toxin [[Clostridium] asparagiforme DSM 15981]
MFKLDYAPRAMDDLARMKDFITSRHGADVAQKSLRRITTSARRLERFPEEGPSLAGLINISTDYRYLYVRPNYLFYRIEGNCVKIVRVLNEKQDIYNILFGLSTVTDEDPI